MGRCQLSVAGVTGSVLGGLVSVKCGPCYRISAGGLVSVKCGPCYRISAGWAGVS